MQTVRLEEREPFITADGSTIRELAGVPSGNAVNQSLAEATVPPGGETSSTTTARRRRSTTSPPAPAGCASASRRPTCGRATPIVIAPGVPHKLWNPGPEPLVLLCCCAPPYSHEDTVLLEG